MKKVHDEKIVGILPTILTDSKGYAHILSALLKQTKPLSKLIIVFQGENEVYLKIKEKFNFPKHVEIDRIPTKSLTTAKNYAIRKVQNKYDFLFVYEDDVEYSADYNEKMLNKILELDCDILSCVEKIDFSKNNKLKAILYSIAHQYPINDRRPILAVSKKKNDLKTNFLSGGLTVIKNKVFKDYYFDENLTKYCLGEDIDFSYRASKNYSTYLTNSIRCLHNSEGTIKFGHLGYFKSKLSCWHYFIFKNCMDTKKKRLLSLISLSNLILFLFWESLFLSIINGDIKIIFNFLSALKDIFLKKQYSDFIISRKGIVTF